MTNKQELKTKATALLKEYDALKLQLRMLEGPLAQACTDYGLAIGMWAFSKDAMRNELARDEEHNNVR